MRLPHSRVRISRSTGSLALLLTFTVTACGGGSGDSKRKSEDQTANPYLARLSEKTCLGIFDKETVSEADQDHDLTQVVAPRDGEDFSIKISQSMNKEMVTSESEAGAPCGILDKSGKKKLFVVTVNWGPSSFPSADRKAGKATSFDVRKTDNGKRADLLVDCQRPDLAQTSKDKKMLAFQVTLLDNVGLSDRAEASILTKSAQRFTDLQGRLSCQNKITYSAPETATSAAR